MRLIKIGNWMFYPDHGRFINKAGHEFFLDKRLNSLLIFLIKRQESVVKRNEIIEHVWSDVQVNEENLTKGIFDLRRLLKHQEIDEIEINTIRNVGYRLRINKTEMANKPYSKLLIKSVMYFLLIASFLIMFIRAIRYDGNFN